MIEYLVHRGSALNWQEEEGVEEEKQGGGVCCFLCQMTEHFDKLKELIKSRFC